MAGFIVAILFLLGIIIFLALRKPEIKIVERVLEIDQSAERLAALDLEISQRRAKANKELTEEYKSSLDKLLADVKDKEAEFNSQIETKKQSILLSWDEEFKVREDQHIRELELMKEEFNIDKIQFLTDWKEIAAKLSAMQDKEHAVIAGNERKEKLKNKDNFYKITLSTVEDIELEELEIAISKLTNAMPFRKAVYDVYYKNKMLSLVKRLKASGVMGIYKITNILNEKVYVGQGVDIGNRWKQHAKRGCGAEAMTGSKLYPALLEYGLSNFTFEIVQIVGTKAELSELEQYWQKFYGAKSFGYSIK